MFVNMPILKVTKDQKAYLEKEKSKTGNSYASLVRTMIQRSIDESKVVSNEVV